MAQLSWGKSAIEFGECVDGATPSEWTKLGCDPVGSLTKLVPIKGEKKEAKVEGGENEAVKYARNTYVFEFEIRAAKGREEPIKDSDGVAEGEYAFRLTPEDETREGILIERSVVSVEESYDTAEGKKWKYTVDVLEPATGDQVKPYTLAAPAEQDSFYVNGERQSWRSSFVNSAMNINKEIEINISDAIVEKAISFSTGKNKLCLYPSTLGKIQILKNLYLPMNVNMELLAINPLVETLRICQEKMESVYQAIAYSTFNNRKSILDMEKVPRRARFFQDEALVEDLATILTIILSSDKIEEFIRYFGIDTDRGMRTRISRVKGEGSSITFGGKSIYGLLIDFVCQRYEWTIDYVLWGINYVSLDMLFVDAVTIVYLSEEERKKLGRGDGEMINADDPGGRDLIGRMISE